MVFASSRDALRRSLVGIAVEIQGTDFSEVALETGASFCFLFFHSLAYHILRQSLTKRSAETDRCSMLPVCVHLSYVLVFLLAGVSVLLEITTYECFCPRCEIGLHAIGAVQ
jgi:hypothetical protein